MNVHVETSPAGAAQGAAIAWPEKGRAGHVDVSGHRVHLGLSRGRVAISLPSAAGVEIFHAAVEAMTADSRSGPALILERAEAESRAEILRRGWIDGAGIVRPDMVWQHPGRWLTAPQPGGPYGFRPAVTEGRVHPERPPKPRGVVYRRHIPWLGGLLAFRVAEPERDLPAFSRWMNDPQVAEIWEDDGPLEKHRAILGARDADPHVLPLIGEFEGHAFGWFEVYWARENRIGPHYDAADYDRGWHVAIGEPAFRGRQWITAWLPSLMHFIFLDDPRTARIVGEPRSTHRQQIRNLDKAGFAKLKEFDFPHKRAMLVMLLRERFFGDRLWAPEGGAE